MPRLRSHNHSRLSRWLLTAARQPRSTGGSVWRAAQRLSPAPLCAPAGALLMALMLPSGAGAQDPASAPASVPAGALSPQPVQRSLQPGSPAGPRISSKQAREADDAYLQGAREVEHKDFVAAQRSFARAVQLDPGNRDYTLALLVTRENYLTQLVQEAARARRAGDSARADSLLAQARTLDPNNREVAQHFGTQAAPAPPPPNLQVEAQASTIDPSRFPARDIASILAGPVEFNPTPGTHSFHLRGDAQTIVRSVYSAFGIAVDFDESVAAGPPLSLDIDDVDFAGANRVLQDLADVFSVAVQPRTALIARDTQENRDRLVPQLEETVYIPGISGEEMSEFANIARNVFDLRQVTASAAGGDILLRGDERTLKLVNATYADMLIGESDILFDVNLYEVDRTHVNNIGAVLPSSANLFSITAEAQSLVNANQSTLNEVLAAGNITLTGNTTENILLEALYLIKYAGVTDANLTYLLATVGSLDGIPLAGLSLASTSTFNLLLNASDVRTLDQVQLRTGNGQQAEFRAGSRYPIITATYSSGGASSLLTTAEQALLSQYTGSTSTSVTIPQFQFEDLGLSLKLTPHLQRGNDVSLKLELKLEALGGTSLDSIPVLNNRTLSSVITVPTGKTAMLAALVNTNELGSIDGLPGLSELPGFEGTDKDIEHDSDELLITITPHIVRPSALHIASRRLALNRTPPATP